MWARHLVAYLRTVRKPRRRGQGTIPSSRIPKTRQNTPRLHDPTRRTVDVIGGRVPYSFKETVPDSGQLNNSPARLGRPDDGR